MQAAGKGVLPLYMVTKFNHKTIQEDANIDKKFQLKKATSKGELKLRNCPKFDDR